MNIIDIFRVRMMLRLYNDDYEFISSYYIHTSDEYPKLLDINPNDNCQITLIRI